MAALKMRHIVINMYVGYALFEGEWNYLGIVWYLYYMDILAWHCTTKYTLSSVFISYIWCWTRIHVGTYEYLHTSIQARKQPNENFIPIFQVGTYM